jgi:GNAT superfamily N-acetyltransferase
MWKEGVYLEIKPYNPGKDLNVIIEIYHSAMLTEPWFEDLPRELILTRIKRDFQLPASKQYIAWRGEIACAAMWWDETNFSLLQEQRGEELAKYWRNKTGGAKTVWFRDLLVAREWQGMGIGSKMVDFAIQQWQLEGYKYALLRVHLGGLNNPNIPANFKAIKLYEKRGFRLIPGIIHITHDFNNNQIKMGYMLLKIPDVEQHTVRR